MARRSELNVICFWWEHGFQQVFEFLHAADLFNKSQYFVQPIDPTNSPGHLGHGFDVLKGNGVPSLGWPLHCDRFQFRGMVFDWLSCKSLLRGAALVERGLDVGDVT